MPISSAQKDATTKVMRPVHGLFFGKMTGAPRRLRGWGQLGEAREAPPCRWVSLSLVASSVTPGMARARYCVFIADGGDEFVYTFYCFAPAFFLARNPTHEEKLAFAQQLATRYNPRALALKPFKCVTCGGQAHQTVDWLRYALRDPGCLAINNTL